MKKKWDKPTFSGSHQEKKQLNPKGLTEDLLLEMSSQLLDDNNSEKNSFSRI